MSAGSIALLVIATSVIVAVVAWMTFTSLSSRKKPQQREICPQCNRAWVEDFHRCPFCQYVRPSHTPLPEGKPESGAPYLTWREGAPGGSTDVPLPAKGILIGRGEECDLRIESLLVSRRHSRIVREGTEWLLVDQDSTNGTYVNGQRVGSRALQEGDQIRIGPAVLIFHQPGELPSRPTVIPSPPRFPEMQISPGQVLQQLGDYRLIRRLGGGGMAAVYLALNPQGQQLAVKVFFQTDPYLVKKFYQEGTIQLRHPHIVHVLDFGEVDHTMFMAMEYIEGADLRGLLHPQRPLPLDLVIPIIGQTCEALQYAHRQGIIHRDIKPENIRLSPSQGVKLLDFGIAKVTGSVTITSDGMLIGTPYYMSYEQAKGEEVKPASDIYSLGVVLYEMLSGHVPFDGAPLDVIHKHLTATPPPPRRLNPDIPKEIESVILKCITKDISQRFSTAKDLSNALGYLPTMAIPPISYPPAPEEPVAPVYSSPGLSAPTVASFRLIRGGSGVVHIPSGGYLTRRELNPKDLTISRRHAQVLCQEGTFFVQDCSTHGTWVDGRHLRQGQSISLRRGAQLQVGQCVLEFTGAASAGNYSGAAPTRLPG